MTDKPKKAPVWMIVLAAVMTPYFLYKLLAGGEANSATLTAIYWGVVILNLVFLVGTFLKRDR